MAANRSSFFLLRIIAKKEDLEESKNHIHKICRKAPMYGSPVMEEGEEQREGREIMS